MEVGCSQCVWIGMCFKNNCDLVGIELLITPTPQWRWDVYNMSGSGRVLKIHLTWSELDCWLHQNQLKVGCSQRVWIGAGFKNKFVWIGIELMTTSTSHWRWDVYSMSGSGRVSQIRMIWLELDCCIHQHHNEGGVFAMCLDRDGLQK